MFTPEITGYFSNITPNCMNYCVCTIQDLRSSMLGVQYCHDMQKCTNDCLAKLLICDFKS